MVQQLLVVPVAVVEILEVAVARPVVVVVTEVEEDPHQVEPVVEALLVIQISAQPQNHFWSAKHTL